MHSWTTHVFWHESFHTILLGNTSMLPARLFEKSTMIRSLAALAKGEEKTKELFNGMAINELDSPFKIGEVPLSVIITMEVHDV
jgi:hypothetical protein